MGALDTIIQTLSIMDYKDIIEVAILASPLLALPDLKLKLNLNKDFQPKDVNKIIVPDNIKTLVKDSKEIKSEAFKAATLEFAELLIRKYPEEVLYNFYNNINSIKIDIDFAQTVFGTLGSYSSTKNKIDLAYFSSIYHELFHMASAYYDKEKNIVFCGFSIDKSTKFHVNKVGIGINEGYTEFLTQRYFPKKKKKEAYVFEVKIAKHLEQIVGKDYMEKYYFTADFYNLYKHLTQYNDELKVQMFIKKMDYIASRSYLGVPTKELKNTVNEIYLFLLKTFTNKIHLELEEKVISIQVATNLLTNYYKSINKSIKLYGFKYQLKLDDVFQRELDSILNFNAKENKRRIQ